MAGLMSRTSAIAQAKFSKLLDRAEDPGETLDYSYEQQLQQLQNVKRGIADVTTAKKRLELQESSSQQQLAKLDDQARQALQAGREDLAREALSRKTGLQGQIDLGCISRSSNSQTRSRKLITGEQALQAKIEAFRSQKEVIKAQVLGRPEPRSRSAARHRHRRAHGRPGAGHPAGAGQDPGHAGPAPPLSTMAHERRGRSRGLHEGQGDDVPRPPAGPGVAGRPGRRRARQDEGRARPGGSQDAVAGGRTMIVRVMGEGQWLLDDSLAERLHELDAETERAVERGDQRRPAFGAGMRWPSSCAVVSDCPTTTWGSSDAIVPPTDLTLEESAADHRPANDLISRPALTATSAVGPVGASQSLRPRPAASPESRRTAEPFRAGRARTVWG